MVWPYNTYIAILEYTCSIAILIHVYTLDPGYSTRVLEYIAIPVLVLGTKRYNNINTYTGIAI